MHRHVTLSFVESMVLMQQIELFTSFDNSQYLVD